MKKVIRIAVAFVLILCLIAGLGIAFCRSDSVGINSVALVDPTGKKVSENSKALYFSGKSYNYKFVYGLQNGKQPKNQYSILIEPNLEEDVNFNFTVNEEERTFFAETDLTKAFDVSLEEKGFSITLKKDSCLKTTLTSLFPEKTVNLPENLIYSSKRFYALKVMVNGDVKWTIAFGIGGYVEGVELSQDKVVF